MSPPPIDTTWISVGKLTGGLRCRRRLALEFDRTRTPAKTADATFRLHQAVMSALAESHLVVQALVDESSGAWPAPDVLIETLAQRVPPPELGLEEIDRFRNVLTAYGETFADSTARFVAAPMNGPYRRPSQRRSWGISGAVDLRFTRDDGQLEIRKWSLGTRPVATDDPVPIADILRFFLIGGAGVFAQLYIPNDPLAPGAVLRERTVTDSDISAARQTARRAIDEAEDLVTSSEANGSTIDEVSLTSSGWWCNQCTYVRNCPAIPQQSSQSLLGAYPE